MAREVRGFPPSERAFLHEGWVIANHILVSFHVAFISSILALPAGAVPKGDVLRFVFLSPETLASIALWYMTFHTAVALHEMGHFLTAARIDALDQRLLAPVREQLEQPPLRRALYLIGVFLRAPYGLAPGIRREGLSYYPDAPYNLAVAAAGPRASRNVALATLPLALLLLTLGLVLPAPAALLPGRLLLGVGLVCLLDFLLADPGKYRAFRDREITAKARAGTVAQVSDWLAAARAARDRMLAGRPQEALHPRLGLVTAPWQFRNCGMGGRHTEKEYPESNISMQEAMFLILSARDYLEAQEMTVRLQSRLKEIIEGEEGCRVMGIGLEGGLAPYVDKGTFPLPEVRLWALMKRAIAECGFVPGRDVAIALDPALSELENAYRAEMDLPDAVGMYLFWRDKAKVVLDRDGVLDLYLRAVGELEIPLLSIEDGFAEDDFEGWRALQEQLGDRLLIIGDDLVTTNDRTIEMAAEQGLINTALIKANQIGSLYETVLAMIVALGKGLEIVVSHRSKSPNDDMEAQVALAVNALGLKAGGGSNTERLVKYQAVTELLLQAPDAGAASGLAAGEQAVVRKIRAYEEPTNAGIPTVGATVEVLLPGSGVVLRLRGATPLGTSAGTGEAIHLTDSQIEVAEHREVVDRFPALFRQLELGVVGFRKDVSDAQIREGGDDALSDLFARAQRYQGKGCQSAVHNVISIIAPAFEGVDVSTLTVADIDRTLLALELETARRRGKLAADAGQDEAETVMQRKQNLGMNAMLSVSLGMARAVARVRGKELYELLREELVALVYSLAREEGVPIAGSQFADYVTAVQEVNRRLTARGEPLYLALRRLSGVYRGEREVSPAARPAAVTPARPPSEPATAPPELRSVAPAPREAARRAGAADATRARGASVDAAPARAASVDPAPARAATPSVTRRTGSYAGAAAAAHGAPEHHDHEHEHSPSAPMKLVRLVAPAAAPAAVEGSAEAATTSATTSLLTATELTAVEELNRELHGAIGEEARGVPPEVVRSYRATKARIAARIGQFGIVNNRVLRADGRLLVPYVSKDRILLFSAGPGGSELLVDRSYPPGTLFTDDSLLRLAGAEGVAVDIEPEIAELDPSALDRLPVSRLRDIAGLLRRVNACHNRVEAVYLLRQLIARICNLSVHAPVQAKNLQPEFRTVTDELVALTNGPLFGRLPSLMRVVVRNLSIVIGKPNLIDRIWDDTIALAEIHVRGSAIVNELRRQSHHALGMRTLALAEATLAYIDTGDTEELARVGFPSISPADEEARSNPAAREILARLVADLERLLQSGETVTRIREWRDAYAAALVRCEFGLSMEEEVEAVITSGLRAGNRWVAQHHLRILARRGQDFGALPAVAEPFLRRIEELQGALTPVGEVTQTEQSLREAATTFIAGARHAWQDELFVAIDGVLESFEQERFFETFEQTCDLRQGLAGHIAAGGFPERRYYLCQLDCLLEEIGYIALRHVAAALQDGAMDLPVCLRAIRLSVHNLEHDGLGSRELRDLAAMLDDVPQPDEELLDVLSCLERSYHKVRQRVTVPYEKMRERLALGPEELRAVLANMQRYMHDLNGMVSFANVAMTHVRDRLARRPRIVSPAGPRRSPLPLTVAHLSHGDAIGRLIAGGDSDANARRCYGGKGSGLLTISHLGIPTRDGFILPTGVAQQGLHQEPTDALDRLLGEHLRILEADLSTQVSATGDALRRLGDPEHPLILAVRGGSVFSMPGILATVVFVGMNDRIAETLAAADPWCGWDSYRRFLESYGRCVWGLSLDDLRLVDQAKRRYGVEFKKDLPWGAMRDIAAQSKAAIGDMGRAPELEAALREPASQLPAAVRAVFDSWSSATARRYREIKGLCSSWHTACVVQEMAFGNHTNDEVQPGMDETRASLTGVVTRTFATDLGARELEGEIKFTAAGDDLVGGVTNTGSLRPIGELRTLMPMLHRRLQHVVARLRRVMGTDQEVELTVERGVLSVLQARTAETGADQPPERFVAPGEPATRGLGVRGGGFRGVVAFDDEDRRALLARRANARDDVDGILMVLENPTPEDIPSILSADGLLTARGGSTSHAAVAANGIEDKRFYAVMSAAGLKVDLRHHEATISDAAGTPLHRIRTGDVVSIHGTSGDVYVGSRERDATV